MVGLSTIDTFCRLIMFSFSKNNNQSTERCLNTTVYQQKSGNHTQTKNHRHYTSVLLTLCIKLNTVWIWPLDDLCNFYSLNDLCVKYPVYTLDLCMTLTYDLCVTYHLFIFNLCTISESLWPLTDMCVAYPLFDLTCVWPVYDLCMTYIWLTLCLSLTSVWPLCDLPYVYLWPLNDLCVTYPLFTFDLSMTFIWLTLCITWVMCTIIQERRRRLQLGSSLISLLKASHLAISPRTTE